MNLFSGQEQRDADIEENGQADTGRGAREGEGWGQMERLALT